MNIYELTPDEIFTLAAMATRAHGEGRRMRVAWHVPSGLMVKVGEGMWTAPMGKPEQD